MIVEQLIGKHRQHNLLLLALFSFMLVAIRIVATQKIFYGFLIFNLILAIIPFVIGLIWLTTPRLQANPYLFFLGTAGWLLFLPNAPYLITDFLHFKKENAMPEWFDVLMLISFASSGLAFGFTSLAMFQQMWQFRYGKFFGTSCIFIGCSLSGVGVYIGRFLRYNSWDILHKPFALAADLPPLIFEPKAVFFSLGYGTFFFLFFRIFNPSHRS